MPSLSSTLTISTDGLDPMQVETLRKEITKLIDELEGKAAQSVLGWTLESAQELYLGLAAANRLVQYQVVLEAAKAGGKCSREKVYELGGYSDDRSLKGFTRPVAGVMKQLQAKGLLPPDAANPMKPIYDYNNPSFQQAQGFEMPAELAALFVAAAPNVAT